MSNEKIKEKILTLTKKANQTFQQQLITSEEYDEIFKRIKFYRKALKMDALKVSAVDNDINNLVKKVLKNKENKQERVEERIEKEKEFFKAYLNEKFGYELETIDGRKVEKIDIMKEKHNCDNCGKCKDIEIPGIKVHPMSELPDFIKQLLQQVTN